MAYEINYDDKRFQDIEEQKKAAIKENDTLYDSMIGNSQKYYQDQINAAKDYAEQQKVIQQEQTQFAIDQVNQKKEQAKKDYIREQQGAYVDYQKKANQYGVNAEQQAAAGMMGGGFGESSQVAMFNTYQNRIASSREGYNLAVMNYDNMIKDAMMKNNAVLAEQAYNALKAQLELSLQGFQYENSLLIEKANQKQAIDKTYYDRMQDVLDQINQENALAEEVRQYNESLKLQQEELALAARKASSIGSSGGYYSIGGSGTAVHTDYYSGDINPDVQYGTFNTTDKNGVKYQPNNVGGKKLSKTGITIENNGVTQNVWQTSDGKYYYWEGRQNEYISIPSSTVKALKAGKNVANSVANAFR